MAEQHKLLEIIEDEATTEATTEIWSGSESDNDVFSSSSSVRTIISQLKSSEIFFLLILQKRIILGIIGWVCRNNR